MNFFKNAAEQNPDFAKLEKYVNGKNELPALVTGVSHIHKAHFIEALLNDEPTLVIAESEAEAQKLCLDINAMFGEQAALLFPEKEFILADAEAASREYEHKRIFALNALLHKTCRAVVIEEDSTYAIPGKPKRMGVYIKLREGDKYHYRNITWLGNTLYPTSLLEQTIGLKSGDVYDSETMNSRLNGQSPTDMSIAGRLGRRRDTHHRRKPVPDQKRHFRR